ncbi:MAG: GNAT family N-acetyltransferase [Devosia sp.]
MRLETKRLIIREWEDRDRAPYAAINADPEVRRYYENIPSEEEVNRWIDLFIERFKTHGYYWLAIERKSDGALIGDVGLAPIDEATKALMRRPADIEIGWLLGRQYWGQGYCPEAAQAWLDFAWEELGAPEIVAFTARDNAKSERVMQKLGMARDPSSDFDNPRTPEGHWLRPHIVYRIANPRGV